MKWAHLIAVITLCIIALVLLNAILHKPAPDDDDSEPQTVTWRAI